MEDNQILNLVFENAIDGIIIINKNGLIEKVNPAVSRLFQYSQEELLGQNISNLAPSPHQNRHDHYLNNYLKTGEKNIIGIGREVEGLRKNGSRFPFILSISDFVADGEVKFLGVVHDISELKKKDKALQMNQIQLEAVFDTAVEGIVIINSKGIIKRVNSAIIELFQYSFDELLGSNVSILMPEPHQSNHDHYIDNYHKTRKAKIIGIGREVQGCKKDGSLFPINLSISEVKLDKTIFFAGIIHDLTERKNNELKFRMLNSALEEKVVERTEELSSVVSKLLTVNKDLEKEVQHRITVENALRKSELEVRIALTREKELSDLKSRFVSMASHEFRTPLSTIRSSAEIIKLYGKETQQYNREKHIKRIKSAVNNLTTILDDFLNLSKLEENKIDLNFTKFNLEEFSLEVKDEMKSILKENQELFFQKINPEVEFASDKRLIKNIMYNLISNAIKYSESGKEIYCRIFVSEDRLHIEIEDQGIGIPDKDQIHLFDRFFRATNVTNIQGTGLGLNIVKSYLELLNGEIEYESKEGKGSIFRVRIPHMHNYEENSSN